MNLTTLKIINGLEIKQRERRGRQARSVPKYGVWTREGALLKDFRRLSHACVWAAAQEPTKTTTP